MPSSRFDRNDQELKRGFLDTKLGSSKGVGEQRGAAGDHEVRLGITRCGWGSRGAAGGQGTPACLEEEHEETLSLAAVAARLLQREHSLASSTKTTASHPLRRRLEALRLRHAHTERARVVAEAAIHKGTPGGPCCGVLFALR
eukprot:CAMPEP_0119379608 /NCGR_PEP_ID=MMETSP1334-20130426/53454_1 /TAXON_ID=127549 /ORGANISM="Calcidiscus leptoporus, Strain RCC1130" /LENGTH=142 /DNA_ID=CAMNT_0007399177 /DNA_START=134 /DNA_END=559 /DNA_ORIENTATION=+